MNCLDFTFPLDYHEPMKKKASIIFLLGLLLLLGCQNTSTSPSSSTAAPVEAVVVTFHPAPTDFKELEAPQLPSMEPEATYNLTISDSPTPAAPEDSPAPTETPIPAVAQQVPAPTLSYVAKEGVDTVAWISDTQHYANIDENGIADIYPTITTFLQTHRQELGLKYVVHTGDLVHRNGREDNWERAKAAMDILGDIPVGVLAGNHDMAADTGGYTLYKKYFGEKVYSGRDYYGESFEDNRGHYDLITLSGREYIFVYMSYAPDEKALKFIKNSFDKYPERVGILCLHDFMTTEGTRSQMGERIEKEIVSACPNVYMVLCGHRYGLYCLSSTYGERTVYEMMQNYQAAGKEGGSGYFRLMQFDEENGEVRILTYSAYLDDFNWLDDPSHREKRYEMDENSETFTLKMPWKE